MKKEWLKILLASCFEVIWVIGLKHANSVFEWSITAIAIMISFYFMIMAGKHLPVGTVYAVFVGLGTTGTVIADIVIFHEPVSYSKIMFICILLAGVVGLKLASHEATETAEATHKEAN